MTCQQADGRLAGRRCHAPAQHAVTVPLVSAALTATQHLFQIDSWRVQQNLALPDSGQISLPLAMGPCCGGCPTARACCRAQPQPAAVLSCLLRHLTCRTCQGLTAAVWRMHIMQAWHTAWSFWGARTSNYDHPTHSLQEHHASRPWRRREGRRQEWCVFAPCSPV